MLGKNEFLLHIISLIICIASFTDLVKGKIYNWLTLPAIVLGIYFNFYFSGFSGIGFSILGAIVALIFYGWIFYLKFMSGGDIKLLMVMGAWGGTRYAVEVGTLSIFVGGVMAVIALFFSGKILETFNKIYFFIMSVFLKELKTQLPEIDRTESIPYGFAISVAALWILLENPFARFGIW